MLAPLIARSRISDIEPALIRVTAQGRARVRVSGTVCGWISMDGQRRFRWGAFDETFSVEVDGGPVKLRLLGLGGVVHRSVATRPRHDLSPPRLQTRASIALTPEFVPRPVELESSPPRAPRPLGLPPSRGGKPNLPVIGR